MHVQGSSQLLRGAGAIQGEGEVVAAAKILRTVSDALNEVLGDGAGKESAKRGAGPKHADENTENQDAASLVPTPDASTSSTAPSAACARVLQSKPIHTITYTRGTF